MFIFPHSHIFNFSIHKGLKTICDLLFSVAIVLIQHVGPYRRALIFLPGPYSLSLFNCIHTMSPTLNFLFILCRSCLALYFSRDFFSVSFTCKWIYFIFSTICFSLNVSPVSPPSLLLFFHIQHLRVKV
jgi:hypothetical protein